jgi:glc operon protein GlcG
LKQALRAVAVVSEHVAQQGRRVAVAVVDNHGDLICGVRTDGTHERVLRFAIRKAYTAAVMGRDTLKFKDDMLKAGRTLADYGDPMFTTLQGGLAVTSQGTVIGGIAVGGNAAEQDEVVAHLALQALGVDD